MNIRFSRRARTFFCIAAGLFLWAAFVEAADRFEAGRIRRIIEPISAPSCAPSLEEVLGESPGEPSPGSEKYYGLASWTANYPGGDGRRYILVNLGNNIRFYEVVSPSLLVARGMTATGLTGNSHYPYAFKADPFVSVDGHQWIYLQTAAGSLWYLDGATIGSASPVAKPLYTGGNALQSNLASLSRLSDGTIVLCTTPLPDPNQKASVVCYAAAVPANPEVKGDDPSTWGTPFDIFPPGWGKSSHESVSQTSSAGSPLLDHYLVMNAPSQAEYGDLAVGLVELKPEGEGNVPIFFEVGGEPVFFDTAAFGRVGSNVYAAISDGANRRFMIFRVDDSKNPVTVEQKSGWTGWPEIFVAPDGGRFVPQFDTVRFVDQNGLLGFADSSSNSLFVYDVSSPDAPVLIPGVAESWYENYVLYDPSKHSYAQHPYDLIPLGSGSAIVAGGSLVFTVSFPCSGESARPESFLIAGAAHAPGASDTTWETDLTIFNPSPENLDLTLQYRPRNQDGAAGAVVTLPSISPGATVALRDVVRNTFGVESGSGSISIGYRGVSKVPALHASTFNLPSGDPAAGEFGQLVPGEPVFPGESTSTLYLEGIRVSADPATGYRSNLGLVNLGSDSGRVTVEIWNDSGSLLATKDVSLLPLGSFQLSLDPANIPGLVLPVASAYARIVPDAGVRVSAYASIIDNRSGDGTFVGSRHRTGRDLTLAGVASIPGAGGTHWKSALFLVNPFDEPLSLDATFASGSANVANARIDLSPRGSSIIDDALVTLFGVDGVSGVLRISPSDSGSSKSPIVSARTYNDAPGGTFGETIPATSGADTIGGDRPFGLIALAGLSKGPATRTNVGLVNSSGEAAGYRLRLTDEAGSVLALEEGSLGANSSIQRNDIFISLGIAGDVPLASLAIESTDGRGSISAYASVVDNRTGDPQLILGDVR